MRYVIGMIDFVMLVNLLHSCMEVPFWKKKKKKKTADIFIAVTQNETKSQREEREETTPEPNMDQECYL